MQERDNNGTKSSHYYHLRLKFKEILRERDSEKQILTSSSNFSESEYELSWCGFICIRTFNSCNIRLAFSQFNIDKLCSCSKSKSCYGLCPLHPPPTLTLLSFCLAVLFSSLWSDQSMWGQFLIVLNLRNLNLRLHIKTHLDNTLYLSSLWSDWSCAAELVIAGAPAGRVLCLHSPFLS